MKTHKNFSLINRYINPHHWCWLQQWFYFAVHFAFFYQIFSEWIKSVSCVSYEIHCSSFIWLLRKFFSTLEWDSSVFKTLQCWKITNVYSSLFRNMKSSLFVQCGYIYITGEYIIMDAACLLLLSCAFHCFLSPTSLLGCFLAFAAWNSDRKKLIKMVHFDLDFKLTMLETTATK